MAVGRADVAIRIVLVWVLLLSPFFIGGVNFGIAGVAAVWALAFPLVYLLTSKIVARRVATSLSVLWAPMTAPATAAAVCAACAVLMGNLVEDTLTVKWVVSAQVTVGAAVYTLLLWLIARDTFNEIRDLFLQVMGIGGAKRGGEANA
jgi:hypothetical protein